jgi:hypothetical protein
LISLPVVSLFGTRVGGIGVNMVTKSVYGVYVQRDTSALSGELPEESTQFRFIRAVCLSNLKGSIGLMLVKVSVNEDYYSP